MALESFLGEGFEPDEKTVAAALGGHPEEVIILRDIDGGVTEPFNPQIFQKGEQVPGVSGLPMILSSTKKMKFVFFSKISTSLLTSSNGRRR